MYIPTIKKAYKLLKRAMKYKLISTFTGNVNAYILYYSNISNIVYQSKNAIRTENFCKKVGFCINSVLLLSLDPSFDKTFCISNIFVPISHSKETK